MIYSEEDPAPFGSRPAAQTDDTISYAIHFPAQLLGEAPADADKVSWLRSKVDEATAHLAPHLLSHLWHIGTFSLTPSLRGLDLCLEGQVTFGDSLLDEWLVIWCLVQLSLLFPDAFITARDTDGEVLLIEAAEYLPDDLSPQTAENRVFIHQGSVHIIPFPKDASERRGLSLTEALAYLTSHTPSASIASPPIQRCISKRLSLYPEIMHEHIHYTRMTLPRSVASALHAHPSLVSPATLAFHYRALDDSKEIIPLPVDDMVTVSVRMTRMLYAQLEGQAFAPPPLWAPLIPSSVDDPSYPSITRGMKLTSGFDMLLSHTQGATPASIASQDSLKNNPGWARFRQSLVKSGYYQDEIEGSQLWKRLEEQARSYYLAQSADDDDGESPISASHTHRRVREIIQATPLPSIDLERSQREDDPSSWFILDEGQLQSILNASQMPDHPGLDLEDMMEGDSTDEEEEEDAPNQRQGAQISHMVDSMSDFIQQEATIDGAVFPREAKDEYEEEEEGDDEGWDEEELSDMPSSSVQALSDPDQIMASVRAILGVDGAPSASEEENPEEEPSLADLIAAMDAELAGTKIGESFRASKGSSSGDADVDAKISMVQNLLASIDAQEGLPGPAGNILGRLGVFFPRGEQAEDTTKAPE